MHEALYQRTIRTIELLDTLFSVWSVFHQILSIVACRPVVNWLLCKQRPLLDNSRNIHAYKSRSVFCVVGAGVTRGVEWCGASSIEFTKVERVGWRVSR
jgi:hypothetical protein